MKSTPTPTATQMEKPHPCDVCFQSKFCLPIALQQSEMARIRDVIQATVRVQKGEALFTAGQSMTKVYSVHAGSFKSYISSPDGREQIVGFHIPGELMGLEGGTAHLFHRYGGARRQ